MKTDSSRETEIQTDRQRYRETERNKHGQANLEIQLETDRQTKTERVFEKDRKYITPL